MKRYKQIIMTLALLLTAVGGAWAQSSPKVYTTQVTVDDLQVGDILAQGFSLVNKESEKGFYFDKNRYKLNGSISSDDWHDLISDITSYGENCTISIRSTGHPDNVFTPVDENGNDGNAWVVTKIDNGIPYISGITFEITEWNLTSQDGKTWTLDKMPGSDIELQVEYYAESNLFLGKEALADKANIAVKNGETAVAFDDAGKSTATVSESNTVTATYTGTKKVIGMTVTKRVSLVYPIVISEVTDEAYIGSVVADDGYVYATIDDVDKASKTAVAKICYVGSETGDATYKHGLALALRDVSENKSWCSKSNIICLGSQYTTEIGAKGDLAGIANTDVLVGTTPHSHGDNAAKAARGYNSGTHPTGTSAWFLPSVGQWDKMVTAVGDYGKLGLYSGYYWSSTEVDADNAWSVNVNDGSWSTDRKYYSDHSVRACLAF